MTPDPLLLDETHAWLDRARRDLRAAKVLIGAEEYAGALFNCQQAAEKALKGFLTFHQRPFAKTHDLSELRPDCLAIDASLQPVLAQADELTKYAWRFRYPGAPYEPDNAQTADGLERAEATLRAIEHRLPPAI
jgi:HEPN domain-containing protein